MTKQEIEAKIVDLQRQCTKLFAIHGLPSWAEQERQRLDNEKSQGTRMPFSPNLPHETYRPKPHETA